MLIAPFLCPAPAHAEVTLTEESMESRQEGGGALETEKIQATFEAARGRYRRCWLHGGTAEDKQKKSIKPRGKGRRDKHQGKGKATRKTSSTALPPGGRLVLAITVDDHGRVTAASAKDSTMGNKAVEDCILTVTRGLSFPPAPGGGRYDMEYPLKFSGLKL